MSKSRKKSRERIPFGDVKFVMNNLSAEELKEMDEAGVAERDLYSWMQEQTEAGWNFSIKWDDFSGAIQVTSVAGYKDMPNAGFAVSARSDDLYDALLILYWKVVVVAEGVLDKFETSGGNVRG